LPRSLLCPSTLLDLLPIFGEITAASNAGATIGEKAYLVKISISFIFNIRVLGIGSCRIEIFI